LVRPVSAADNHNLGIGGLRELKRRFDAAPTQVRIGDALTDDVLELAYPFRLNLPAF